MSGLVQVTTISGPLKVVTGATGVAGTDAARMDMVEESTLLPIALRAFILNGTLGIELSELFATDVGALGTSAIRPPLPEGDSKD